VIIADTSGLLALFNDREPAHARVRAAIQATSDSIVVSPFVIAELDYLLTMRVGVEEALAVARELAGGAYEIAPIDAADVGRCADVVARYRDQGIGMTDASLVVLADRHTTRRILTLDRRHFDVLRPLTGGRFVLVGP